MKQLIFTTLILSLAFSSLIAKADCSCVCVSGRMTEICANSWDSGGTTHCSGYCSDTKRPNMNFNFDSNNNIPNYTAPTYIPDTTSTSSYNKTTRNAATALGAIMLLNELSKPKLTPEQIKLKNASNLIKSATKQKKQAEIKLKNKVATMNLPKDLGDGVLLEELYIVDKGSVGLLLHITKSTQKKFGVTQKDLKLFSQTIIRSYCTSNEYLKIRNQGIGIEMKVSGDKGQWVKSAANLIDCIKNGYL